MKQKLLDLSAKALRLIKDPDLNDPAVIARLGPVPVKLQQMHTQLENLEAETNRIEELLTKKA